MNHKRKRSKNQRAGCLMCKPQKVNGAKRRSGLQPRRQRRADVNFAQQVEDIKKGE